MSIVEYEERLKGHDWYYEMSDDYRVWESGLENHYKLLDIARQGSDEHKKLYNKYFALRFHKEPFAQPYKFPFPEVV